MAKYLVRCYYSTYVEVEVEANNQKEAEEVAWEEAGKPMYDVNLVGNCVHDFADVEELDED